MMKRTIEIAGIKAEQGLCMVEFKIRTCVGHAVLGEKQATHWEVYDILDKADSVEIDVNVVVAKHGGVEIEISQIGK